MRIGELAALAGVSTRTVRHYHHQGVLPEPPRRVNGYREYGLRDALRLARARRLTELGLSLDEVRDVLAGDSARELREILLELDADLARQEARIRARRERLAALLSEESPSPDDAVSPRMAEFLRCLEPVRGSAFAAADAELLALLDTAAEPEDRDRLLELMRPMTTPEALARAEALHRRLAELDDADAADSRVAALAADFAAHLPPELAASLAHTMPGADDPFAQAFLADLSPAQAEVVRQAMALVAGGEPS
ncbi:MerR family transcriptional regulator [Microbispora rosea]|uniref:MerR family transcriptional regulator n=1 Tax=Microbispora rosea TaxID=58117 RepID=UPI0004C4617D|nr:MerR family transcriptional regulator [Microbispora rosea]